MPGFFIAVEGPEGAGKSTQLRRLAARLRREGVAPLMSKEPGGTPVGERVRDVVLDPDLSIGPLSEFLLYSASRAQLVESVLRPALAAGRLVLCDRFTGASVAYQGYGRGLPHETVQMFNAVATGGLEPHLTLLFDLEPEVGLARVAKRGHKDRLEQADLAFHRRVRAGFLAQAARTPSWRVFDATLSEETLHEQVWGVVKPQLEAFLGAERRSCDAADLDLD